MLDKDLSRQLHDNVMERLDKSFSLSEPDNSLREQFFNDAVYAAIITLQEYEKLKNNQ